MEIDELGNVFTFGTWESQFRKGLGEGVHHFAVETTRVEELRAGSFGGGICAALPDLKTAARVPLLNGMLELNSGDWSG